MEYCPECSSSDLYQPNKNQLVCRDCGALLVDDIVFDQDINFSQTYRRNSESKTKNIYNRWSLLLNKISQKHLIDLDAMFIREIIDYLFKFIEIFYRQNPDRQNMICINHIINRYCRQFYPPYEIYFPEIKTLSTRKKADKMIDKINQYLVSDVDGLNLIKLGTP